MAKTKNEIYHLESVINDLTSWEVSLSTRTALSPHVVMTCFAVEKTLKCLIKYIYNMIPTKTHNLETLMKQLPDEVFFKLSEISGIKIDDLRYVLVSNKHVFNEWRYAMEENINTGYISDDVMRKIISSGIIELRRYLEKLKSDYPSEIWVN